MWTSIGLLAILFARSVASIKRAGPSAEEIEEAFKQYMIVPQVIAVAPNSIVSKLYNNKYEAYLGNEIPLWVTRYLPYTSFPNADPDTLYSFIGIDPDYPQFFFTDGTQLLIELFVNVPGADFAAGDLISPVMPLSPIPNTGEHRYIYLAYRQVERINVTTELVISMSTNFERFNITEFVETYNLGIPVAGNFFVSEQLLCEPAPCIQSKEGFKITRDSYDYSRNKYLYP